MLRRAVLLVILVGCGKKDSGPSCEQVVDHMLEVTKQQLMGHETVNLSSQRKAMVAQCESRNMTTEMRTCLLGAQTIADIAKCRGGKTDMLERPRRPRPGAAPTPTGSGSSTTSPGSAAGSGH